MAEKQVAGAIATSLKIKARKSFGFILKVGRYGFGSRAVKA